MDEWSTDKNPKKIWNSLKKANPQLDEPFFRLPDGRWDINRLNQEMDNLNQNKQNEMKKQSDLRIQNTLIKEQRVFASNQEIEMRKASKKQLSKEVDFSKFNIAMGMFCFPIFIQLLIISSLSSQPLLVALAKLWGLMPVFVILNLFTLVSIPFMTRQLAVQINKLDYRSKNLL
jgi:hypothetical protein